MIRILQQEKTASGIGAKKGGIGVESQSGNGGHPIQQEGDGAMSQRLIQQALQSDRLIGNTIQLKIFACPNGPFLCHVHPLLQ